MALIGGHHRRRAASPVALPDRLSRVQVPSPDLPFELLSLIQRHGRDAVVAELARLTAKRGGRPRLDDLELLGPQFERDARALLEGRDPQKVLSNKKIAVELAAKLAEGKSEDARESTERRLKRVLSENRAERILWKVISTKGHGYPHAAYLAALRWRFSNRFRLSEPIQAIAENLATYAERSVSQYREQLGEPPERLSMGEIEAAMKAWSPPLSQPVPAAVPDPTSGLGVLWRTGEGSPES
jgi:hypothetical protein